MNNLFSFHLICQSHKLIQDLLNGVASQTCGLKEAARLYGKRIKKRVDICICVCITDSLFCTPETNTTLLINYTPI